MAVASRASSTHVMYRRDLPALLDFAMKINETELALDLGKFVEDVVCILARTCLSRALIVIVHFCVSVLADEIMAHPEYSNDSHTMEKTREHLRSIGTSSLDVASTKASARSLRRIFKLLGKVSRNSPAVARNILQSPDEFVHLIRTKSLDREVTSEDLDLISFLAREAGPQDVLTALGCLQLGQIEDVQPILQTILQRAAHASESSELSVSLMKIHHARMGMKESTGSDVPTHATSSEPLASSIWQRLGQGKATIAK